VANFVSTLRRFGFVLALALVPLTAADNTTNAMSMITHTTITKAKITVYQPLPLGYCASNLPNQKKGATVAAAAHKERKGVAEFHYALNEENILLAQAE
jgi:hypothetical protein